MRIRLGMPLTAKDISDALNGNLIGLDAKASFIYLSTDSREVYRGDLYIPLKGETYNGENFIEEVISKGAIPVSTKEISSSIKVASTENLLLTLASYYKSLLKSLKHTVAITGSVGKTTTKEFTKLLLESRFKTHATIDNFNNKIGLPLTVMSAPENTEFLVLEMGMNHKGEISELSKCVNPTISVITNIGSAHIGNLGSRENIACAKLEILDGMKAKKLVIPYGEPLLKSAEDSLSFSSKSIDANVYIIYNEGNCVICDGQDRVSENIGAAAPYLLECLAAAIGVCREAGVRLNDVKHLFSSIFDKNIRQNTFFVNKTAILADYYNASLESVTAAIEQLFSMKEYEHKSALLGDILELGDKAEEIHYTIGKKCGELGSHSLYLFGKYSDHTEAGAISADMPRERIYKNFDLSAPDITAKQIYSNMRDNEIILFKASHAVDLGRVVYLLKEYGCGKDQAYDR